MSCAAAATGRRPGSGGGRLRVLRVVVGWCVSAVRQCRGGGVNRGDDGHGQHRSADSVQQGTGGADQRDVGAEEGEHGEGERQGHLEQHVRDADADAVDERDECDAAQYRASQDATSRGRPQRPSRAATGRSSAVSSSPPNRLRTTGPSAVASRDRTYAAAPMSRSLALQPAVVRSAAGREGGALRSPASGRGAFTAATSRDRGRSPRPAVVAHPQPAAI